MFADRRVQPFKGTLRGVKEGDEDATKTALPLWRRPDLTATKSAGFKLLSHCPGILMNMQFSALSSLKQEIRSSCVVTLKVSLLQEKYKYPLEIV